MKAKKKVTKKVNNMTERLYVYTTKTNKKFIERLAKKSETSNSTVVHNLINQERNSGKSKANNTNKTITDSPISNTLH